MAPGANSVDIASPRMAASGKGDEAEGDGKSIPSHEEGVGASSPSTDSSTPLAGGVGNEPPPSPPTSGGTVEGPSGDDPQRPGDDFLRRVREMQAEMDRVDELETSDEDRRARRTEILRRAGASFQDWIRDQDAERELVEMMEERPAETVEGERPWARYEGKISKLTSPNTWRGLGHPDVQELGITPETLTGKVVLDLGSGLGGLAKSAVVEEVDTVIISSNPNFRDLTPQQLAGEQVSTAYYLRDQYGEDLTNEQIIAAQAIHDSLLLMEFAHDLRSVPDESIDLIVDLNGPMAHMDDDVDFYKATLDEEWRVLRPGGRILIGGLHLGPLWNSGIPQAVMAERNIRYDTIVENNSIAIYKDE
jgi:SAM-dependent methyltransferase